MKGTVRQLALVPVLGLTLSVLVVPSGAGPDKVKYPAAWKDHVLYTIVDRHDVKQYRELYASSQAAVDAMKAGTPLPDGTVLTLVQYKAQVDGAGMPVKGPDGRFVKGDQIAVAVRETRAGCGPESPPAVRTATSPTRNRTSSSRWPRSGGWPAPPPPPSLTSPSRPSPSGRTRWPGRLASRSPG